MNETLMLMLAWAAGGGLGAVFFGGLWWTVRKGVSSKQPALWFFASLLVRMSIALAGFYFVGRGMGAAGRVSPWVYPGTPGRNVADPAIGREPNPPAREASHAP